MNILAVPMGLRPRLTCCLVAACTVALVAASSAQVLIKEVVSREASIHVGGVQTPEIKEVVSLEASLFIENGPASPYSQVLSREVSLVLGTSAAPPQVTGYVVTPSPTGDSVSLDWTNYNPWAVQDLERFEIYISDTPFGNVIGLTPVKIVGGETVVATIDGLTPFKDHFVAIVAVDALGNRNTTVINSAAYIISPQLSSREVSLFVGEEPTPPYKEIVSREVSLAVASARSPAQVTDYAVVSSPIGDSATLDWTSYNPWAVKTVAHFDIYVSGSPFTDVTGLTPVLTVGGETVTATVSGLPPFRDHYFAVVAVDALGNRNPAVINSAAYIISPQVISREVSLFIGGEPSPPYKEVVSRETSILVPDATVPAPVTGIGSGFTAATSTSRYRALDLAWPGYNEFIQQDVVRYRVYVDTVFFTNVAGMTPTSFVPAGTQTTTAIVPQGNEIYYSAVIAEDALGNFDPVVSAVSAQSSLSEVWVPTNSSITYNGAALQNGATLRAAGTLQADATVAAAITRVDFFVRPGNGSDVLLKSDTTPGDGFTTFWNAAAVPDGGYLFTIRAFDKVGRFTELTRNVNLRFNYPPVIAGMTFDAANLVANAIISRSGRLGVVASDNDGITSAEFFYQRIGVTARTSLGTDATPANGLDVPLNLETLNDGNYDLTARVYDSLNVFTESTRRVNLQLGVPAAPAITSPLNGTTVLTATVQVQGTAPANTTLKLYSNGTLVFTGTPAANGSFSTQVTLTNGANAIRAVSSNRAGDSLQSNLVTVTKGVIPPVLTLSLASASVTEGGTVNGTIVIDKTLPQPLTITLGTTQSGRLTFPASVIIPAGQLSAPFTVQTVQNQNVEGPVRVTLIASATGATAVTTALEILDDDIPALQFVLNQTAVAENSGANALQGTLTLSSPVGNSLSATFSASPSGQVTFPAVLAVPANTKTISVPITVVDNNLFDGNRSITITANLVASGGGILGSRTVDLAITDDEAPSLSLAFDRSLLIEGRNPAGSGIVTRNVAGAALQVALTTSQPAKLIVPASVTIAAGETSATFPIQAINDNLLQGNQTVQITATATGLNPGVPVSWCRMCKNRI